MRLEPDVVLFIGDHNIKIHLAILSVRIPYLLDALQYSSEDKLWKCKVEGAEELSDNGAMAILLYIYGERAAGLAAMSLLDLFLLHKFGCIFHLENSLCAMCDREIFQKLNIENVEIAYNHASRFMHEKCLKWCNIISEYEQKKNENGSDLDIRMLLISSCGGLTVPVFTLREDIQQLFTSGEHSDFVIDLMKENGRFDTHSFVLGARSSFFRTMFHSGMIECTEGICRLPDVRMSAESFRKFLLFLYTDEFTFSMDEASSVMKEIDFFQLDLAECRFKQFFVEKFDVLETYCC